MTHDDQFAAIAKSLRDLAAIDDGLTVTISHQEDSVAVTRVEFNGWVQQLTEHSVTQPKRWTDGLVPILSQPWFVKKAVLHASYMQLAGIAFDVNNLLLLPSIFNTMDSMLRFTRTVEP